MPAVIHDLAENISVAVTALRSGNKTYLHGGGIHTYAVRDMLSKVVIDADPSVKVTKGEYDLGGWKQPITLELAAGSLKGQVRISYKDKIIATVDVFPSFPVGKKVVVGGENGSHIEQAIVDALKTCVAGDTVQIKPGYYFTTNMITLKTGVTIEGIGPVTIEKLNTTKSDYANKIFHMAEDVTLRNLNFTYQGAGSYWQLPLLFHSYYGEALGHCPRTTVTKCSIENMGLRSGPDSVFSGITLRRASMNVESGTFISVASVLKSEGGQSIMFSGTGIHSEYLTFNDCYGSWLIQNAKVSLMTSVRININRNTLGNNRSECMMLENGRADRLFIGVVRTNDCTGPIFQVWSDPDPKHAVTGLLVADVVVRGPVSEVIRIYGSGVKGYFYNWQVTQPRRVVVMEKGSTGCTFDRFSIVGPYTPLLSHNDDWDAIFSGDIHDPSKQFLFNADSPGNILRSIKTCNLGGVALQKNFTVL